MKLYKTILRPQSHFATSLKGGTLFGQLCWSVVHFYGEARLKALLDTYDTAPFLVVSDGFVPGFLPKPSLPGRKMGETAELKKENRKKVWLTPEALSAGRYAEAKTDAEVGNEDAMTVQVHNALDYRSFRTGTDPFTPFGLTEWQLGEKELYCALDESQLRKDELEELLRFVGRYGYGKKSSIGKGRFEISGLEPAALAQNGKTFMTLSSCTLEGTEAARCWYDTQTHFGKHGAGRARGAAFKRPVLLAQTGAVLQYDSAKELPYSGRSLRGVSAHYDDTVQQGYAITVAIKEVE